MSSGFILLVSLCVLSLCFQRIRKWARPLQRCPRPSPALPTPVDLCVVCREPALPLHVRLWGRVLGALFMWWLHGGSPTPPLLCPLVGPPGPVALRALHVLLPTFARLPTVWGKVWLLRGKAQGGPMRPGLGVGGVPWTWGIWISKGETIWRDVGGGSWCSPWARPLTWPSKAPGPSTAFRSFYFQPGAFLCGPHLLKVCCTQTRLCGSHLEPSLWISQGWLFYSSTAVGDYVARRVAETKMVCTLFQMSVFFLFRKIKKIPQKQKMFIYIKLIVII